MKNFIRSLIISLVLAVPSPAWAECAWVLWNEAISFGRAGSTSDLVLLYASPAYERCEQVRLAKAKDLLRITETDKSGPNVARVTAKETGNMVTRTTYFKDGGVASERYWLRCLPDTIDPRGPQGGG